MNDPNDTDPMKPRRAPPEGEEVFPLEANLVPSVAQEEPPKRARSPLQKETARSMLNGLSDLFEGRPEAPPSDASAYAPARRLFARNRTPVMEAAVVVRPSGINPPAVVAPSTNSSRAQSRVQTVLTPARRRRRTTRITVLAALGMLFAISILVSVVRRHRSEPNVANTQLAAAPPSAAESEAPEHGSSAASKESSPVADNILPAPLARTPPKREPRPTTAKPHAKTVTVALPPQSAPTEAVPSVPSPGSGFPIEEDRK